MFTVQYSTVQYSTVQYSTVQYSTVQYSTVQYSTVQYSTVQYSTVQYSTVQYSTVQYSTVQYSTVQYSTVQYSTVQYSTTPRSRLILLNDLLTGLVYLRQKRNKSIETVCKHLCSIRIYLWYCYYYKKQMPVCICIITGRADNDPDISDYEHSAPWDRRMDISD